MAYRLNCASECCWVALWLVSGRGGNEGIAGGGRARRPRPHGGCAGVGGGGGGGGGGGRGALPPRGDARWARMAGSGRAWSQTGRALPAKGGSSTCCAPTGDGARGPRRRQMGG